MLLERYLCFLHRQRKKITYKRTNTNEVIDMVDSPNDSSKYISMESFGINWFFYVEDMEIPEEDIKNIKPLSKDYSTFIWNMNINNRKHHFALLSKDEKLSLSLTEMDYHWQQDWNNGTYENLSNYLSENIICKPSDKVIVFWQKEHSVETSWDIFLRHWANFLFDDEGVILVSRTYENILLFTSDGMIQMGKRLSSNSYILDKQEKIMK